MATQLSEFCTVDVVNAPNGKGQSIVIAKPHGGLVSIDSADEAYLIAQRLMNAAYEISTREGREALVAMMRRLRRVPG